MPYFYCEGKLVVEQERPFPRLIVAAIPGINYRLATGYLANKHSQYVVWKNYFYICLTASEHLFLTKVLAPF